MFYLIWLLLFSLHFHSTKQWIITTMLQFWKIPLSNFQFYDPYKNCKNTGSLIWLPYLFHKAENGTTSVIICSVSNPHVKPIRFMPVLDSHFWKPFSGSIPGLRYLMVLKVMMAVISFFFFSPIFHLKTLILFTVFKKQRKQSNLDWTTGRNVMWDAEEKKRWILKFSSQNARRWTRRSEKCYKNKTLCIASLLLDTIAALCLGNA